MLCLLEEAICINEERKTSPHLPITATTDYGDDHFVHVLRVCTLSGVYAYSDLVILEVYCELNAFSVCLRVWACNACIYIFR